MLTVTRTGKWRPGQKVFTLRLYCDEPGSWHPLSSDGDCYEIPQQPE